MPLYEWQCECSFRESVWASMADRDGFRPAHDCGQTMHRLPGGHGMLYFEESRPHVDIGLSDKPITSKKQRDRLMKAAGVVEAGDNLPKAIRDNPGTVGMKRYVEKDSKRRWI